MSTQIESGYRVLTVFSPEIRVTREVPTDDAASAGGERVLQLAWNWRAVGKDTFDVMLYLELLASKDMPYRMSIRTVGRFGVVSDKVSVPLSQFVSMNAIAVLMPYVRERVTTLSLMATGKAVYLPALDVTLMRDSFDLAAAAGAKQLGEPGFERLRSLYHDESMPTAR